MAEFDLTTIKRKMLRKYPAFGSTISSVKYQIVGNNHPVKTAATDGKTIYCNETYLGTLSEDQQVFVFAHEVCHIALNHIMRSEGKDPELWNIATDAVINEHLQKDGLPMVEGGVDIKGALKYDAEELYQKLLAEKQKQQAEQNNEVLLSKNKSSKDKTDNSRTNNKGKDKVLVQANKISKNLGKINLSKIAKVKDKETLKKLESQVHKVLVETAKNRRITMLDMTLTLFGKKL